MNMLESIRKDSGKQGNWLLIGAGLLFMAGSALLDGIWQGTSGLAVRALAWGILYLFLGWMLLRQIRAAFRADIFGVLLVLLAVTLWIRFPLMSYESKDYIDCLREWTATIRLMPGASSLGQTIGDYNVPYFYFLFLIAKAVPAAGELYWIKLFSIAFEAVCAVAVMLLVSLATKKRIAQVASLFAALILPSVILNGSAWGQCDAVYTALGFLAVYCGLKRKSRLSFLLFALAFSFKLQTVFFLPVALALLFTGRIRFRDIWVFFAAFLIVLLPAVLAGRPFLETISIYYKQSEYYEWLHMNAPTIFGFFAPETGLASFARAGILAAGAVTVALTGYLYLRRDKLDASRLLDAAYLSLLSLPFFLPHMHERYFFAADVMGAVYLARHPKDWYLPAAGATASFLCYFEFLFDQATAIPLGVLSLAMAAVIGAVLSKLIVSLEKDGAASPQTQR